jgi:hypothetical protein
MPELAARDNTALFYRGWVSGPTVVFGHAWAMSSGRAGHPARRGSIATVTSPHEIRGAITTAT